MSTQLDERTSSTEQYEHYRALSTSAVASLIVGLLSISAILDWSLVAIPLLGIPLSLYALITVKRNSHELSGLGLARAGLVLSVIFALVGPAWLTYSFLTELPDGYERVSYAQLQPHPDQPNQIVPPEALELEGKDIFIKGYIYPGREKDGIRQFLLVRDQGDCCFGGNPKITDRIQVTLVGSKRLRFEPRLHKVGGKFHVEAANQAIDGAKGGVLYHLEADYLD